MDGCRAARYDWRSCGVMCLQWQQVSDVFKEHVSQSSHVKQIHVFVLSNVLRRPIIVIRQHNPDVMTDDADALCGIYLPALHSPADCCRSPLVVIHVAGQFVPLVPRAAPGHDGSGLQMEPGVPLWRADANEPLMVRCLLDSESAELALSTYLRVVELPHTSATSIGLFPVAKYDVIAPDINILDEYLVPAESVVPPVRKLVCCNRYIILLHRPVICLFLIVVCLLLVVILL